MTDINGSGRRPRPRVNAAGARHTACLRILHNSWADGEPPTGHLREIVSATGRLPQPCKDHAIGALTNAEPELRCDMKLPTIGKLLEDQLKDIYNAETQLVKALPKMAKKASSRGLKDAITSHLEETKRQA